MKTYTTKFEPGEKLFFLHNHKITEATIDGLKIENDKRWNSKIQIIYFVHFEIMEEGRTNNGFDHCPEESAFSSREELIMSIQ